MALLTALRALSESSGFNFKFSVFHVEHGLRPPEESRGDAVFVLDFCGRNGIECKVRHIPRGKIVSYAKENGTGIEAAARYFRHKALRREALRQEQLSDYSDAQARKKAVILLAHTKDDLLETSLMRILRGAGPAGLSAMRPRNKCAGSGIGKRGTAAVKIERPLLNMTRSDIENYLEAKNVSWREDSTNNDEKFFRNRIRHNLAPFLDKFFPQWKTGVSALGETQSLVNDFILHETKNRIKWEEDSNNKFLTTDEMNFLSQPRIIREEAVFCGINILFSGKKFLSKSVKRSVIRRFCKGSVNAADLGLAGIRRGEGKIFLSCKQKDVFERGISRLILNR